MSPPIGKRHSRVVGQPPRFTIERGRRKIAEGNPIRLLGEPRHRRGEVRGGALHGLELDAGGGNPLHRGLGQPATSPSWSQQREEAADRGASAGARQGEALVHESPGRSRRLSIWGFPTT